jgi:class 3 adenylate cyclase/tetratricopeptide (TPR) repeat protein
MRCTSCGSENDPGRKFCGECGVRLAAMCPSCGSANGAGVKFCGECGATLGEQPAVPAAEQSVQRGAPETERRLVSVLFADLVGFTTLSESRDAEEVRDLLSRYFDTCRQLITRYGGTVEKFIGDAVMAVWGAPIAQEDDAERAVRAALELTTAVAALGQDVGAPMLAARAGVLTGEAAVNLAAQGQGMVAGDLVNTASRIQSVAPPGAVFVGDATKHASEAAIDYQDAGEHELKGKTEPVALYRAIRVVGTIGGTMRATGIEPPFTGRDRELRMIKELFHATAEERRAHLVSVLGLAGIGKSRLSWEFEKYIDGLIDDSRWHRGRCLAYGEGVAFWALSEMVRGRAGILEDEESSSARPKLHASVVEHIQDPEEQRFVEPRLAHLLGLEERGPGDQENLFSAWRIFFERMSETLPVIMVFEDIHWADSALLDFVEYLLDWSKDHPIFVLTLARPDLSERRPTWGAGKRDFTSLFLDPLPPDAMDILLTAPVPGLPDELRQRILERAEGVPFYAVETVRMLLDRGLLVREGNAYRVTEPIETLEIPETLQALIAARLDGLAADERRMLQDASVLGRTFTVSGLSAMTGLTEAELEPLLTALVRKEVLTVSVDPLSSERGQFGFLQDLVKKVAYDTMSKKERKTRHLSAAAHLLGAADEDEIIEVVAAHYVDAYRAAPADPDAQEIKERAADALVRAGERAASLAANAEAQRHFELAAEMMDDSVARAELLERAGVMASGAGRQDQANDLFERSIELFEGERQSHPAARVSARLAQVMWDRGRLSDAVERMNRSFQILSKEEPDSDLATLAAQLGRLLFFSGEVDVAADRIEVALEIAEAQGLPETLSQALITKSIILIARARRLEGLALLRYALDVALEHEIPSSALRAYFNLADAGIQADAYQEAADNVTKGLALARRVGNRYWEWQMLGQVYPFAALGNWDEVLDMVGALPPQAVEESRLAANAFLGIVPSIHINRGDVAAASASRAMFRGAEESADLQERAGNAVGAAALARAEGRYAEALAYANEAFAIRGMMGIGHEAVKDAFIEGVEAALALGQLDDAEEMLRIIEKMPPGRLPQYVEAHARRFRSRIAILQNDTPNVEQGFKNATGMFREMAVPFWMAVTMLEHGEWLVDQERAPDARPLLDEARAVFEGLRAAPWLERLDKASATIRIEAGA